MKISLVVPVFNEARHLDEFFAKLFAIVLPCDVQYVVVDDASTDDSWSIIKSVKNSRSDLDMIIFSQAKNAGKGAAIHKGIELATGAIITIQDADFEYDPRDLAKLIEPILQNRADVVYGSRFHKSNSQVHRTFHYLVNRILTLFSNVLSGLYLTDMETCYKVFRAEIIKSLHLESKRFGFEPEVTAAVAKLKLRVEEYPISYFPRNYLEGKKINWKDGIAAFWFIIKYNLRTADTAIKKQMPNQYLTAGRQWL